MNLIEIDASNVGLLYETYQNTYKELPIYWDSPRELWESQMLHGVKDGEPQFHELKTYAVRSYQQVLGWIQFGQPNIYIDIQGCKLTVPSIGVIRNFYFEQAYPEVGKQMLLLAKQYFELKQFKVSYAFNHDLGALFHAYHGKLHERHLYIENVLFEVGYQIEHENIYYSKCLINAEKTMDHELRVQRYTLFDDEMEIFDLMLNDLKIGQCKMRYFKLFKLAYMKTIWIEPAYTHRGFGTRFMTLICDNLCQSGYEKLDLDTAHLNVIAQKYYEKNGFTRVGLTRSYTTVKEGI